MANTTLETIDELLQGASADVDDMIEDDDGKVQYKINSARQLLEVIKQRQDGTGEIVDEADIDEDVLEDLQDLGYMD